MLCAHDERSERLVRRRVPTNLKYSAKNGNFALVPAAVRWSMGLAAGLRMYQASAFNGAAGVYGSLQYGTSRDQLHLRLPEVTTVREASVAVWQPFSANPEIFLMLAMR